MVRIRNSAYIQGILPPPFSGADSEEGIRSAGQAEIDSLRHRQAAWPQRIIELAGRWSTGNGDRELILVELWPLLKLAVAQYIRIHVRTMGPIDEDEVHDLAAEKALCLVVKLESGDWTPSADAPARVRAMLSTVARHGLIDHLRSHGPQRMVANFDPSGVANTTARSAEAVADARRYASAIRECVNRLGPRAGTVWVLRVLLELPSKQVATHAAVDRKPEAVDMIFSRARAKVMGCLQRKGYSADNVPPGAFVHLWDAFCRSSKEDDA